jgi:signal transduction histidine kinase
VALCLADKPHAILILEIADNGIGIAAERTSGVGLQSMRERAEELGGQLTLESVPEGGTLVVAELPLKLERTNP